MELILEPQIAGWGQFWWFVASLVISYHTRPDLPPGPQDAVPATLEEFATPSSEDGAPVTVLFGRRHTRSPQVKWYGDLATEPIRESIGG